MYAPDLEAIEVDIFPKASVADNEDINSSEFMAIPHFMGLSAGFRMSTITTWASNKPTKPTQNPMPSF